MKYLLYVVPGLVLFNLFFREVLPAIVSKITGGRLKKNIIDYKLLLLEWVIVSILMMLVLLAGKFFVSNGASILILLLINGFGIALFPTYRFVLRPIILLWLSKKRRDTANEVFLHNTTGLNYKVVILDSNITNAYATGILPPSKTILLGKPLLGLLQEDDVHHLMLHEAGHLKKNHLAKLYAINVLCCLLFLASSRFFYPAFMQTQYPGLYVFLHGFVLGALLIVLPGLTQRKMEYEADMFAASLIGKSKYIQTLRQLDIITNGNVSKGGLNYPTLQQREDKING